MKITEGYIPHHGGQTVPFLWGFVHTNGGKIRLNQVSCRLPGRKKHQGTSERLSKLYNGGLKRYYPHSPVRLLREFSNIKEVDYGVYQEDSNSPGRVICLAYGA